MLKSIISSILVIMLCGCGFHLQGKHEFSPLIKNLILSSAESKDPFQVLLKDSLKSNGVIIEGRSDKKIAMLEVSNPNVSEQINGYDSRGQISQYRITSACSYKLFGADGKILLENTISRSRTYSVDPNRVLSNSGQQQIISEELNIEIINELLRQLSKCC